MAYYKIRIEVWCDWNPAESDVEEIGENISAGEAHLYEARSGHRRKSSARYRR